MIDGQKEEAEGRHVCAEADMRALVSTLPAIGQVFDVPYPFVRDTYVDHIETDEGWAEDEVPCWRPGTRCEQGFSPSTGEWSDYWADAMGAQVLTVVGVYKPGRYAARVFYTRQWRDPDGKTFGKGQLRIKGAHAFTRLTRGYFHPFELKQRSEADSMCDAVGQRSEIPI